MRSKKYFIALAACLFLFPTTSMFAQRGAGRPPSIVVSVDHTNGIYAIGETIHWRVDWRNTSNAAPAAVHYTIRKGEMTDAGQGDLAFKDGIATLDSQFDSPGHFMITVGATGGRGGNGALGGVLVAPEKITPSAPPPSDFDAFWDAKLKELAAVPANPQLTSAESGKSNVFYWKITMDNIRGSHIYGQLAKPAGIGKYPALLVLQWAGVYALQTNWVTDRAAAGWLTLDIEPHDMPIDASDKSKAPNNWFTLGSDDREQSYFLRMYLSAWRATQYLSERPDWNGQTLIATGDSMGGQQSLMIAGFHPKITGAIVLVPSGCDMLGPEAGRRGGFPQWYDITQDRDPVKVHEASRYFDVVNFASRIHGPVLVSFGLIDEISPPSGIMAAFNQIKSPKLMLPLNSPHQNVNGSQVPFTRLKDNVWLPALRDGKLPPMN